MIKILFFIPDLSGGGAEKVLCNLVNNMDLSIFDITVQTVQYYDYKKYLKNGIHYKSIFHSNSKIVQRMSHLWYRFCTEYKLTYPLYIKDDYDIEVAYLECGATKVMAASTNKKAKKIAWVHCDMQKIGVVDKRTGEYYSCYDKVVCVSQDVKKSFDQVFGEEVSSVVINNVIDEDEILEKSNVKFDGIVLGSKKQMVAVGRLSEVKNYGHLIDVCTILKEEGYDFHLTILGDGPERDNLQKQITDNNMDRYISLEGYVSNPYPWIKNADYVICSSKYEGISTVVQEALILEKIVITTPCGGMQELLGDSEYGLIAEDTDDGLYLAIKKIIDEPQTEKYYMEKINEKRRQIEKKQIVHKTQEFFKDILSGIM
ncbi:MAG: glycosyltransferase [Lachnospiraceae bacterium]|nr:glycosyltransferase [Lachnospiraceae bacterium]